MPPEYIVCPINDIKLKVGDEVQWNYPRNKGCIFQDNMWYKVSHIRQIDNILEFKILGLDNYNWWYFNTEQFSVRSSISNDKIDYLSINRQVAGG